MRQLTEVSVIFVTRREIVQIKPACEIVNTEFYAVQLLELDEDFDFYNRHLRRLVNFFFPFRV